MTASGLSLRHLAMSLGAMLLLVSCAGAPGDVTSEPVVDPALSGAWVDGVQSGSIKVYITELRFNNRSFEWTWDGDLQQRGAYDTRDRVLTITIRNNYGSPQRLLGDYSRPYSIVGSTLTWGGSRYTKK